MQVYLCFKGFLLPFVCIHAQYDLLEGLISWITASGATIMTKKFLHHSMNPCPMCIDKKCDTHPPTHFNMLSIPSILVFFFLLLKSIQTL